MILCKKCGFKNYDGTRFCQKCGVKLPRKSPMNFSVIAGTGMKGVSIAPLAGMANDMKEEKSKNTVNEESVSVKTVPLEDGSWYCPDCGQRNDSLNLFCSGCGRYK